MGRATPIGRAAPSEAGKSVSPRDAWLSPVELQGEGASEPRPAERRVWKKGLLPLKLEQYLELLDWTGRQTRPDQRGQIPAELLPILERLRLSSETWVETVLNFGRWFRPQTWKREAFGATIPSQRQRGFPASPRVEACSTP